MTRPFLRGILLIGKISCCPVWCLGNPTFTSPRKGKRVQLRNYCINEGLLPNAKESAFAVLPIFVFAVTMIICETRLSSIMGSEGNSISLKKSEERWHIIEKQAVCDSDVCNIVLSYLIHSCFRETAETFIARSGMRQPAEYPVDMDKRKSIFHYALEGNALRAIELTEQLAPNLLEQNKDLHFDLLSLHFVELVRSHKCTEALEFAQSMLTPFGKMQKYVEKLEDFMALLAYEEPEKSPMFHLLSLEHRQNVAENLNRSILAHADLPRYSLMERLIQQATVVRQQLHQEIGMDSHPLFSLAAFLKS